VSLLAGACGLPASPSPTPSHTPHATASPSASTSSPSASPSPSPGSIDCAAASLRARLLLETGAAGSRLPTYVFFDTATAPCALQGEPGLTLLDASGRVLWSQPAMIDAGAPRVQLTPGVVDPGSTTAPHGSATADYRLSDWCMTGTLSSVQVILPAGGSVAAAGALQLPPCLSSPGNPPLVESHAFAAA
jgi:hypothetical protein